MIIKIVEEILLKKVDPNRKLEKISDIYEMINDKTGSKKKIQIEIMTKVKRHPKQLVDEVIILEKNF